MTNVANVNLFLSSPLLLLIAIVFHTVSDAHDLRQQTLCISPLTFFRMRVLAPGI